MKRPTQPPFFVYGTLLPEQPNYSLWQATIVSQQPATFVGGQLYDMGYYPMLVTSQQESQTVQGRVIQVEPTQYLAVQRRLDNLEGYDPNAPDASAYRRRLVDVLLENGRTQTAWVYLGAPQFVKGKTVVPSGDGATCAADNQSVLQAWWQAINSVAGLHEHNR